MKFVPNAIPETLEIFGLNRKIFSLLSTIPLTDNASNKNTTKIIKQAIKQARIVKRK